MIVKSETTRRGLLKLASAGLAMPLLPRFAVSKTANGWIELRAQKSDIKLYKDDAPASELWTYNGESPGPEIRVIKGDTVRVRFINDLDEPTSIHWHGIRILNAMDGVSGMTQDPVPPGGSFDYEFVAPDAGTYWYHAHNMSWSQVARGLYGPLIIDEPKPVLDRDHDITLMIDDWRLTKEGVLDVASLGNFMDWTHAGRLGNWLTVNGKSNPELQLVAGEYFRLRLINASNARILELDPDRVGAKIIAYDGQMTGTAESLNHSPLRVGPAQRVDLMIMPEQAGMINLQEISGTNPFTFARFKVSKGDGNTATAPTLVRSDLPKPDIDKARKVRVEMTGGAMGRIGDVVHKGKPMTREDFRKTKQVWALNGVANLADEPLFRVPHGETILLETDNQTAFVHAMHVHGHHFEIISRSGKTIEQPLWRDTFLIDRQETTQIAFVADNPGKWLFHCHMLEHAAAGMNTWFEVL